jgi:hypothetical protein
MTPPKIYLDEDVHHLIAHALRHRGWEALTTVDAGRPATEDLDQIRFAADSGHAILTYNITHFPRLHYELMNSGDHHAGIIVATQENPSANARTMLSLVSAFAAEDLVDELI